MNKYDTVIAAAKDELKRIDNRLAELNLIILVNETLNKQATVAGARGERMQLNRRRDDLTFALKGLKKSLKRKGTQQ